MIHVVPQSWSPDAEVSLLVTGPGARVPDEWRPVAVDDLSRTGLLELDALEPLHRKGVLHALDQRLRRYPQYGDANLAVVARPRHVLRFHEDSRAATLPSTPNVLIGSFGVPIDASLADVVSIAHTQEHLRKWEVRDPFGVYHHESAHALTEILRMVPGIDAAVSELVSAALHRRRPLRSLADLTVDDRVAIAQQLGDYAATGDYTDDGAELGIDADGNRRPACAASVLEELCAEAAERDTPRNRASLPLVRGIGRLLDEVLGRGSPVAAAVNSDLHRRLAAWTYLHRTRPAAVERTPLVHALTIGDELDGDPDFRWELEHPLEPPGWLLDHLVAATGFERQACAHHLMHASPESLVELDPLDGLAPDWSPWRTTMVQISALRPNELAPQLARAVRSHVESIVAHLCGELRATPLPDLGPPTYAATYDGTILPRELRASATGWSAYLARHALGTTLPSAAALPDDWTPDERLALQELARGGADALHRATLDVGTVELAKDSDRGEPFRQLGSLGGARAARRARRVAPTTGDPGTAWELMDGSPTHRSTGTLAPTAGKASPHPTPAALARRSTAAPRRAAGEHSVPSGARKAQHRGTGIGG